MCWRRCGTRARWWQSPQVGGRLASWLLLSAFQLAALPACSLAWQAHHGKYQFLTRVLPLPLLPLLLQLTAWRQPMPSAQASLQQ